MFGFIGRPCLLVGGHCGDACVSFFDLLAEYVGGLSLVA